VRRGLRDVALRYAALARERRGWLALQPRQRGEIALATLRLAEIERLLAYRYGSALPDDDSGRDDLRIVADHIMLKRGEVAEHIAGWARLWAPWLSSEELAAVIERAADDSPQLYSKVRLGIRLGLTKAERDLLHITTFRYPGQTDEVMAEERREKDRLRKAARRAEARAGKPPSERSTEPWRALGISRRTYYRNKRKPGWHQKRPQQGNISFVADGNGATATSSAEPVAVAVLVDSIVDGRRPHAPANAELVASAGLPWIGDRGEAVPRSTSTRSADSDSFIKGRATFFLRGRAS
jgi:hypothetical protein